MSTILACLRPSVIFVELVGITELWLGFSSSSGANTVRFSFARLLYVCEVRKGEAWNHMARNTRLPIPDGLRRR